MNVIANALQLDEHCKIASKREGMLGRKGMTTMTKYIKDVCSIYDVIHGKMKMEGPR